MDFDDLEDIQNEYVAKERFENVTILVRGGKKIEDDYYDDRVEQIGQLATEEDVANLGKIEDLKPLLTPQNLESIEEASKDMRGESHAIQKEVKADTPFKEFYNQFKTQLAKNEFWQVNLFNCLDLLSDMGKTSDLLFDQVLNYFDGEIEPTMFLIEHRTEVVADFLKTKKDIERKKSKKNAKKVISNVTRMAAEYGNEEDLGLTNHEVL